jgi:hypothetical protein
VGAILVRNQANEGGDVIVCAVAGGVERPEVNALRVHGLAGPPDVLNRAPAAATNRRGA